MVTLSPTWLSSAPISGFSPSGSQAPPDSPPVSELDSGGVAGLSHLVLTISGFVLALFPVAFAYAGARRGKPA